MALYPGKLAYCGIALQGASTTPVTPRKYLPVKDIDFNTVPDHTYVTEYRNKMESSRAPIRSGIDTTGSLSAYAYPDILTYTLWGAMGAATTTTPAANVYKHALSVNPSDIPSWTMHQGLSTLSFYSYPQSKVKTWKMSLKGGEPLTVDVDYVSSAMARSATITPTYQTTTPPRAFTFADASAKIETVATTLIQEMDLTIERETEAIKTMNASLDATYIYPQDFKASGNLKMFFDSETEFNRFQGLPAATTPIMQNAATPIRLDIYLIGSAVSATYLQAVTLTFPEVYYDKMDFKRASDGYVGINFDFTAAYNETAGYSMTAEIQNGVTLVTPV